jgi:hypothetical protein
MVKLNKTIFITAFMFATSAHAMSPDVPQEKQLSCEERFIDKFMACNSSGGSRFLVRLGLGQCSERLMASSYEQCSAGQSEKEKADGAVWFFWRTTIYGQQYGERYDINKFSLVSNDRVLRGSLSCSDGAYSRMFSANGIDSCDIRVPREQVRSTDVIVPCLVPAVAVHTSIFPALKALHAVQEKQREKVEKKEKEELEKRKIKHVIHPTNY